jgi:hypothetical protein
MSVARATRWTALVDTAKLQLPFREVRLRWDFSRDTRSLLAICGLGILATALIVSFFGPITVLTRGPPPAGAAAELQALDFAVIVSWGLVGLGLWRGPVGAGLAAVGGGVVAVGLGLYLSLGIWKATLHGGFFAPFTLQGALLLQGACSSFSSGSWPPRGLIERFGTHRKLKLPPGNAVASHR